MDLLSVRYRIDSCIDLNSKALQDNYQENHYMFLSGYNVNIVHGLTGTDKIPLFKEIKIQFLADLELQFESESHFLGAVHKLCNAKMGYFCPHPPYTTCSNSLGDTHYIFWVHESRQGFFSHVGGEKNSRVTFFLSDFFFADFAHLWTEILLIR